MKISLKITFLYSVLFSLVLIALSVMLLLGLRYHIIIQTKYQLTDHASIVRGNILDVNGDLSKTDKEFIFETDKYQNILTRAYDINNIIVYSSYAADKYKGLSYKKNLNKIVQIKLNKRNIMYLNEIINTKNGIYYVQYIKDLKSEYGFLRALLFTLVQIDFLGIIISIVIGFLVTRRVLKPIDTIIKQVRDINANDLNKRLKEEGPNDELKGLAVTFNQMLERVQDSFERQSRFISDASHELRTPIAAINGYVDLLNRWGKDDKSILQESLDAIKKQAEDMNLLIQRLLFIARGNSNSTIIKKELISLNDVIKEVADEAKIITNKHVISTEIMGDLKINADRDLIKEMLRIFIDNGIKYTPEGGTVKIKAFKNADKNKIIIEDTGIGIPEDEIPKIFERFYRVEKSRAKEGGSWGLGLSIAKWIIDEHNWNIDVKSKVNKGTQIIITIP